jgi:hypothetical protein
MAVVVFGVTYLVTAAIYAVITALAVGERARSLKAVSPALLSPLGVLFALFAVFTATQVWGENERASAAINREASALRSVVIFAASFPGEPEMRLRGLVHDHISEAAAQEWPSMAQRAATLKIASRPLIDALQLTLALTPGNQGQQVAQREITAALESALDARRQRILVSQSGVGLVKWACLALQAVCTLLAIAAVQSDNRLASKIALVIFATGVGASLLLLVAFDRPFTGELSVGPEPLLQVMPETVNGEAKGQ